MVEARQKEAQAVREAKAREEAARAEAEAKAREEAARAEAERVAAGKAAAMLSPTARPQGERCLTMTTAGAANDSAARQAALARWRFRCSARPVGT